MKRRVNWRKVRIAVQIVAFAAVVAYFLSLVYPLSTPWRPDLLFQLDPLTHLYLLLTGNDVPYLVFAVAALLLLFALSRLFCGWLCPLGAMLDFVSGVRGRLKLWNHSPILPAGKGAANPRRSRLPANFDVYLLVSLLVVTALGSPLLWVFDPIVFSFKLLTVALLPVVDAPLRGLYNGLDSRLYQQDWWHFFADGYNQYFSIYQAPTYADTLWILLFAAAIFGLELYQPRFWCRYICPLGALTRLTYKLHPLRRRIRPDCTYCLQCETACHFGGTGEDDCFYCMDCISACQPETISFLSGGEFISARGRKTRNMPAGPPSAEATVQQPTAQVESAKSLMRANVKGELDPDSLSRRLLLQYAAAGALAYPLVRLMDNRTELPADFIRPPGVGDDEARFTELCIKCGQCLKVCLTNGLQPALTEGGLSALWTPRLVSRLGYCEFNCNLCGQACPTGAIPNLPLKEKQFAMLGMAYFDLGRCIPYDVGENCTVCEEHCPTADKAIKFTVRNRVGADGQPFELLRPYVVPQLCIGCGICEYICPVPGLAAIRVLRRPPGPAYGPAPAVAAPAVASPVGEQPAVTEPPGSPADSLYPAQ